MQEKMLNQLLAKQAICDVIYRYARGLDRMDKAMAYAVWHDGGTAIYHDDIYQGSGRGFVDWVWGAHEAMTHHSHQMNNILIELDDEDHPQTATSETYATVSLISIPDKNGQQNNMTAMVRYLDRWSCRNDIWAIDHRVHVLDMQLLNGEPVAAGTASQRNTNDPSFQLFSES